MAKMAVLMVEEKRNPMKFHKIYIWSLAERNQRIQPGLIEKT